MEIEAIVAFRVRQARKEQGLTLDSLAAATGLSYATVQRIEAGKSDFELKSLRAIAAAVKKPTKWFFVDPEDEAAALKLALIRFMEAAGLDPTKPLG